MKDIREFPLPKDQKDIKNFQSIIGQILPFNPDTSHGLVKTWELLEKNTAFILTDEFNTARQTC